MPVSWNEKQRSRVEEAFTKHPLADHGCADAAREVIVVAREIDGASRGRIIRPRLLGAKCVLPSSFTPRPYWTHHVTVAVTGHCVDGLTGSPGEPAATYLTRHFQRPDLHVIEDVDLDRDDL
jgi:hypothetical protein